MYKVDDDIKLSDGEISELVKRIKIADNCGIYFEIGKYRCSVNPATYFTFEKIHGESYASVLRKYLNKMAYKCEKIDQVFLNIYRSMGYTDEEFLKDYRGENFSKHLANIIGEVMLDYKEGNFNFMTTEERHRYSD